MDVGLQQLLQYGDYRSNENDKRTDCSDCYNMVTEVGMKTINARIVAIRVVG